MAKPDIDPSEHNVEGLRPVLDMIDDVDELQYMLEWEQLGDDRSTAKKAIRSRIDDIENGDSDTTDGGAGGPGLDFDLGVDKTTLAAAGLVVTAIATLYLRFATGLVDNTFEGMIVFGVLGTMIFFALYGDHADGTAGEMPDITGPDITGDVEPADDDAWWNR